jgi:hypothetical protein
MIVEYVGLTREGATIIEQFRTAPTETKADIIVRVLGSLLPRTAPDLFLDLGQGVKIPIGERIELYLPKTKLGNPDAVAEARVDGLFMDGEKYVAPRRGDSPLHPAMRRVQERKNNRNSKGELISLSAFRQWYVKRNDRLVRVDELKDSGLARKRSQPVSRVSSKSAAELGF